MLIKQIGIYEYRLCIMVGIFRSITVIKQLPKWVEYGAFILAFTAGYINVVGLLGFEHQSISHVSGSATLMGSEIINTSFTKVLHLLGVLISFLIGAALSGFLLSGSSLKLGRHYGVLLTIEGFLLLAAMLLLKINAFSGHYIASAACGLQNALVTTYSGAIIRTTHLTGIFTDLGIMLGAALRGATFDKRKALLFILIISGFILGSMVGAFLFQYYQFITLVIPALICFILAVSYHFYSRKIKVQH